VKQKKLSKEFLNKSWGMGTEQSFQKRAAENWHDGKMKRQH